MSNKITTQLKTPIANNIKKGLLAYGIKAKWCKQTGKSINVVIDKRDKPAFIGFCNEFCLCTPTGKQISETWGQPAGHNFWQFGSLYINLTKFNQQNNNH